MNSGSMAGATSRKVPNLIEPADGVDRLPEADEGGVAEEVAQRLEVVLGQIRVPAVEPVEPRSDGEPGTLAAQDLADAGEALVVEGGQGRGGSRPSGRQPGVTFSMLR